MDILKEEQGDILALRVRGRLDAEWADLLSSELGEFVRAGSHRIRLDLSELEYLSSAGIRVLIMWRGRLAKLGGSFTVANPSEFVLSVLKMVGLDRQLMGQDAAPAAKEAVAEHREVETDSARLAVYELDSNAALQCECIGDPDALPGACYSEANGRNTSFPKECFGLGIGAFGTDFAECRGRFGEFVAAAGVAACMPTDGTRVPDYMAAAGKLIPEVHVLEGLRCSGGFAHLLRFVPKEPDAPVRLSELAEWALSTTQADAAGLVIVAATEGLMGAALRRSPTQAPTASSIFAHPEVREWLTFTSEPAFANHTCLAAGVVARPGPPEIAAFLRPMCEGSLLLAHVHAAALSYCNLQQGRIDMHGTVASLFETEALRSLLHLLTDDRPIVGVGESEFTSGACWCAPIEVPQGKG